MLPLLSRLLRDLIGLTTVIVIAFVLGFAWNLHRTKPLPFHYYTPKERHILCGC